MFGIDKEAFLTALFETDLGIKLSICACFFGGCLSYASLSDAGFLNSCAICASVVLLLASIIYICEIYATYKAEIELDLMMSEKWARLQKSLDEKRENVNVLSGEVKPSKPWKRGCDDE